jgi:hypothetical protein
VNQLVLSGTGTLVPSGTGSSCYRGPEFRRRRYGAKTSPGRNFPNLESFGFLLTDFCIPPTLEGRGYVRARHGLSQQVGGPQ